MKLKLKIRLRMLRDSISNLFTPEVRKALKSTFLSIIAMGVFLLFAVAEYQLGYAKGVSDMANRHETAIPMCASRSTAVRENPTGYILSKINRGDVVWVVQLQVPFAVVWYSDGHSWYLGTTTASNLVPCVNMLREDL